MLLPISIERFVFNGKAFLRQPTNNLSVFIVKPTTFRLNYSRLLRGKLTMYGSKWIRIGSIFAAIGVACGALGSHALKTHLTANTTFDTETTQKILQHWSTGVQYLLIHSIAIILTGLVSVNVCSKLLTCAGSLFSAGIVGFSGGLLIYNVTLVLTGTKILPIIIAIVPVGGISFIIGWGCLAASLWTGNICHIKNK